MAIAASRVAGRIARRPSRNGPVPSDQTSAAMTRAPASGRAAGHPCRLTPVGPPPCHSALSPSYTEERTVRFSADGGEDGSDAVAGGPPVRKCLPPAQRGPPEVAAQFGG